MSIEGRSSVCCFLGCASVISGETSTTQSVQTEPELEVWLGSSVRCCGGCPSGIAEDTAEWATSSLPVAKMTGETIGETTNGGVSMSGETVVGTSDVGVSVSGGDVGLFCRDRSFFVPVLDCPLPSESVHSESVMEGKSGGLDGGGSTHALMGDNCFHRRLAFSTWRGNNLCEGLWARRGVSRHPFLMMR